MDNAAIHALLEKQREFYHSGRTRPLEFRVKALHDLKNAVHAKEDEILEALRSDLRKPGSEAYLSEVGFLYEEIDFTLKHLRSWAKPKRVTTALFHAVGTSWIYSEPLGVALIIGPWNYPFQLVLSPLVGAIAAGNCAVLKPSELAPKTSTVIAELIKGTFDPEFLTVVEGAVETSTALLAEKFDHIFFTGGTQVGKVVMAAAAKHLTPVTLELGGKSPCIVDREGDLDGAARRLTWGKFLNAGQTCVAPDYVLVPRELRVELIERVQSYLSRFFGPDPFTSIDYARIVSERHFHRLLGLLAPDKIALGGRSDSSQLYLAPTVMADVSPDDKVMADEIFGPILPVLDYDTIDEAIAFVNARPKPLALYLFSSNAQTQRKVLEQTSFGGGCVNDTLVHLSNPRLPFGGVGESGMGAYHGKHSFDTFSHRKSVVRRSFLIDPMVRYPPYKNRLSLFRKMMS